MNKNYKQQQTITTTLLSDIIQPVNQPVINQIQQNCNKKFIDRKILNKHLAAQGMIGDIPVIAFRMSKVYIEKFSLGNWHCINYSTYPNEPRFLTALYEKRKKEDGRPSKNEKILGLLGFDVFDINSNEIYLVEGIWDMLYMSSLGYPVLGLPGVNNFDKTWLPLFKNKTIYIIFDNDEAGEKYAYIHAKEIFSVTKEVKIVKIPKQIEDKPIKDICDIINTFGQTKNTDKIIKELIQQHTIFSITLKDRINNIIEQRGNSNIKEDTIVRIITEDIQDNGGSILAYNDGLEWLMIPDGKTSLIDSAISSFMRDRYGYCEKDIWKIVRDKLYTYGIQTNKVKLYIDSVHINNKIYIGFKNKGILVIEKNSIHFELQGYDDIYIKTENLLPDNFIIDKKDIISFESLFEGFNFLKEPNISKLLILSWFYYSFFDYRIKPLLILVGASGSGKTFLQKLMKGILFGFDNSLPNTIPEEDYVFNLMVKNNKYLYIDEVKHFGIKNSSILIKFRSLVTGEEMIFRPKYAKDSIMYKPSSYLILASDNPRLMQESDISQRACLVELDRYGITSKGETNIFKNMETKRYKILNGIIQTLQKILINLDKNKDNNIPLKNPCRLYELADFVYKAFPQKRKECLYLFDNMMLEQEIFSAEQDPLIDILEEIIEELKNIKGELIKLTIKQIYNLMQPKVFEKRIKMPASYQGLSKWIKNRESILVKKFGMKKEKDLHTKNFIYIF